MVVVVSRGTDAACLGWPHEDLWLSTQACSSAQASDAAGSCFCCMQSMSMATHGAATYDAVREGGGVYMGGRSRTGKRAPDREPYI